MICEYILSKLLQIYEKLKTKKAKKAEIFPRHNFLM